MSTEDRLTVTGAGGVARQGPEDDEIIAQWVMYPADSEADAVGVVLMEDPDDQEIVFLAMRLERALGEVIVSRGVRGADIVEPGYAAPLPLRSRAAAARAAEHIMRGAVSGRMPVFPLDKPSVEKAWRALVGMAVHIESRIN